MSTIMLPRDKIRRRVFRVAMERGIRYERRKKLLDADADVGGPSQRVNYESNNEQQHQQRQLIRMGMRMDIKDSAPTPVYSPADDDDGDGDMPLTPGRLTTPKTISDEHSHWSSHFHGIVALVRLSGAALPSELSALVQNIGVQS